MQAEVRYLPSHKREGDTFENVERERPNAARTTTPKRIFAQTNPIIQPGVYKGGFSFNGGLGEHHVATCRSKWQLGRTSSLGSSSSSISSSGFSTSSLVAVCATSCSARFKGNQRGGTRII